MSAQKSFARTAKKKSAFSSARKKPSAKRDTIGKTSIGRNQILKSPLNLEPLTLSSGPAEKSTPQKPPKENIRNHPHPAKRHHPPHPMQKYHIPQYPAVPGKFRDQDDFARTARATIARMIQAEDCNLFGQVTCGVGGGYIVPLDEDFEQHPVELFVFIVRPPKEYQSAAEVIADTWAIDVEEQEDAWNEVLGRNIRDPEDAYILADIPVAYVFENQQDAQSWLNDYLSPHD
jgi:hypothetical protein